MSTGQVLDQIGECLNYIAFMDEKDHAFVMREFGGGNKGTVDEEIVTNVAMVQDILSDLYDELEQEKPADHIVVCLGGMSVHTNGSPIFGCLVYGPFTKDEVEEKAREIRQLEGGAVLIRPLVDLSETYRRISRD